MTKIYRHGEIAFVKVAKIPKLPIAKSSTFATGSHGNHHTFKSGKMYLLEKPEQYVFGYFVAKNTKLFHPEHSPNGCGLPNGKYEMRKQVEFTPAGFIHVID